MSQKGRVGNFVEVAIVQRVHLNSSEADKESSLNATKIQAYLSLYLHLLDNLEGSRVSYQPILNYLGFV